jgi:hypothetical protein
VAKVEEWREKCLLATRNALRSRPKGEEAFKRG